MPLINLKVIKNTKGNIVKILNKKDKNFKSFGECYISEIKPNGLKAWRYHIKNSQKITVIEGKCKIVMLRNKKFKSYILSSKNPKMLDIPNKIWYGFKNLTKKKVKILNITDKHFQESEVIRKKINEILFKW